MDSFLSDSTYLEKQFYAVSYVALSESDTPMLQRAPLDATLFIVGVLDRLFALVIVFGAF